MAQRLAKGFQLKCAWVRWIGLYIFGETWICAQRSWMNGHVCGVVSKCLCVSVTFLCE